MTYWLSGLNRVDGMTMGRCALLAALGLGAPWLAASCVTARDDAAVVEGEGGGTVNVEAVLTESDGRPDCDQDGQADADQILSNPALDQGYEPDHQYADTALDTCPLGLRGHALDITQTEGFGCGSWQSGSVQPVFPPNTTCIELLIANCAGAYNSKVKLAISEPSSTANGTVVLNCGGGGSCLFQRIYADKGEGMGPAVRDRLLDAGLRVVQVSWEEPWNDPDPLGQGDHGPGLARLGCKPATLWTWLHEQYGAPNGSDNFCLAGNSGGGAQIAWGIEFYGGAPGTGGPEDFVDVAVVSSGPATADHVGSAPGLPQSMRFDPDDPTTGLGCAGSSAAHRKHPCTSQPQLATFSLDKEAPSVDLGYGFAPSVCSNLRTDPQGVSASDKQRLLNDSLTGPDAALFHPNMRIHAIWGDLDTGAPVGNGQLYFDALTGNVTVACAHDTGHAIAAYVGGATELIDALCQDCGGNAAICNLPLQ